MEIVPPSEAYRTPPEDNRAKLQSYGYTLPVIKAATRSKDGEMLSVYEGFPVPRKGLLYFDALNLNNQAKRRTLTTFSPFAHKTMILPGIVFVLFNSWQSKIKWLEVFLWNYVREVQQIYNNADRPAYLNYAYYNNCSKMVWDLIRIMLTKLGISEQLANEVGWIFANLLEYDDYYKLVVEDPLTEMTAEEAQHPRKFLLTYIRILGERNVENQELIIKYGGFAKILSFALWHPKINKAWKEAFASIDFKKLQLDEMEYFWQMNRANYNVKGLPIEVRFAEYCKILRTYWKDKYPDAGVEIEDEQSVAEAKLQNSPTFQKLYQEGPLNLNLSGLLNP